MNENAEQARSTLQFAGNYHGGELKEKALMEAQVYATLALAEEQRTANVIAFTALIESPVSAEHNLQFGTRRYLRDLLDLQHGIKS